MNRKMPRWGWETAILLALLAVITAYVIKDGADASETTAAQIRGCERGQVRDDVLHDFLTDAAAVRLQSAATIRDDKGRETEAVQNEQIAESYLRGARRIENITVASCEQEVR